MRRLHGVHCRDALRLRSGQAFALLSMTAFWVWGFFVPTLCFARDGAHLEFRVGWGTAGSSAAWAHLPASPLRSE